MRIAKPLLMISLSVFLLAVSWSLLTGQLLHPRTAYAQLGGDVAVYESAGGSVAQKRSFIVTTDGSMWGFALDGYGGSVGAWSLSDQRYIGNVFGNGAVPTTQQDLGSVKGQYRSGN